MPMLLDTDDRAAVLARAVEGILVARGAAGLTMRAIADASGVSTSSIQHHLRTRDHLLGVCAQLSLRSRTAELTEAVIDGGPLELLPLPGDDLSLRSTRVWLGWHEVWRTLPRLGDELSRARSTERAVLAQALDHQVPRDEVPGLHALVNGLREAVCLPGGALPSDRARDALAQQLSRALGSDVGRKPLVPRGAWGWPLVPGPRVVARGDGGFST